MGKTTSVVNVAHEVARAGGRDPRGAATDLPRAGARGKGGGGKGALAGHAVDIENRGGHLVPAALYLQHLDLHLDAARRPTDRLAGLLTPLWAEVAARLGPHERTA